MSHFTVGVICKELNDYEKLLAPYQENNMGYCPKEYLKFTSTSKEEKKRYENDTTERFVTDDGKYLYTWDSCFKVRIDEEEYEKLKNLKGTKVSSYGWGSERKFYKLDHSLLKGEVKEVPYKELCPTFGCFMEEYGDGEFDKEMNDYGYWENPNAKWDWYVIGGRWSNNVLLKNDGRCDFAKLKDINFGVDNKRYVKNIRFWEIVVEDQPLKDGEERPFNLYKKEYYLERYKDKEDYATRNSKHRTFALITPDGKWYEKGQMGWFGFEYTANETIKNYDKNFENIVNKEEYQDYYFVLVDCHI